MPSRTPIDMKFQTKVGKHVRRVHLKFQLDPTIGLRIIIVAVKLDSCTFYVKIWIWPFLDCIIDANLVITWSHNPHAKTQIPGKPSKSGLIGVWHKDNLYLSTSTIGNGDPHPMNIDSRTRSIRMTPRRQLFFNKLFFISLENHGREIIISLTHTHKVWLTRSFINLNWNLHVLLCFYLY